MRLTKKESEQVSAVTKALAPFEIGDFVRIGKEHSHTIRAKYVGVIGQIYSTPNTHAVSRANEYMVMVGEVILFCHKDAIHYATEDEIAQLAPK